MAAKTRRARARKARAMAKTRKNTRKAMAAGKDRDKNGRKMQNTICSAAATVAGVQKPEEEGDVVKSSHWSDAEHKWSACPSQHS